MKRSDRYATARRKSRQEQMMNKATADITHNMMMNTKLIGLTLVILTMSVTAQAQNDAISRFFDKYAGDDSFTQVTVRSEEHTSELQSRENLVCRLLLEKKKI